MVKRTFRTSESVFSSPVFFFFYCNHTKNTIGKETKAMALRVNVYLMGVTEESLHVVPLCPVFLLWWYGTKEISSFRLDRMLYCWAGICLPIALIDSYYYWHFCSQLKCSHCERKTKWGHLSLVWTDLLKVRRRRPQRVEGDLSLLVHRSKKATHAHTHAHTNKHAFLISLFVCVRVFVVSHRHTHMQTCTLRQRHMRGQSSPSVITLDWSQTITQCDPLANCQEKNERRGGLHLCACEEELFLTGNKILLKFGCSFINAENHFVWIVWKSSLLFDYKNIFLDRSTFLPNNPRSLIMIMRNLCLKMTLLRWRGDSSCLCLWLCCKLMSTFAHVKSASLEFTSIFSVQKCPAVIAVTAVTSVSSYYLVCDFHCRCASLTSHQEAVCD